MIREWRPRRLETARACLRSGGDFVRLRAGSSEVERRIPWFIILNSPQDLDELWRKIEHPDLVLMKGERAEDAVAGGTVAAGKGTDASRGLVQSVKISGRVVGESADLGTRADRGREWRGRPVWVPIRLDNQRLVAARESRRDLDLRQQERGEWQVRLTGRGEHRITVEVRALISNELARRRLSMAIPEAAIDSPRAGSGRPRVGHRDRVQ